MYIDYLIDTLEFPIIIKVNDLISLTLLKNNITFS